MLLLTRDTNRNRCLQRARTRVHPKTNKCAEGIGVDALAPGGARDVVEGGDRVNAATPVDGSVADCDLSLRIAALALGFGFGETGDVIFCARFHAGLEADTGPAGSRLDVRFTVVGGLTGSNVA